MAVVTLVENASLTVLDYRCEAGPGGDLLNSAVIVDGSGTRAVYRKAHLWDNEKISFTPGDAAPPVVDTEFGRVAVMVCYDLEFPEWTRLAALDGADLIAAPVNWPGYSWPEGERPAEVVKAQAAAAANIGAEPAPENIRAELTSGANTEKFIAHPHRTGLTEPA